MRKTEGLFLQREPWIDHQIQARPAERKGTRYFRKSVRNVRFIFDWRENYLSLQIRTGRILDIVVMKTNDYKINDFEEVPCLKLSRKIEVVQVLKAYIETL